MATSTHVTAHAGCGIVTGSRPDRELGELEDKARAQLEAALGRASPAPAAARCGHVTRGTVWRPPPADAGAAVDRRVLLIDFEDSFVHNLADYFRRLGAAARVASIHDPAADAWTGPTPTHLVLSPGPGRPRDFPQWRSHLDRAKELGIPVLGVCLGHQALAEAAGARIVRAMETVHGRATPITRTPAADHDPVLSHWHGVNVGRYHSLVAAAGGDAVVTLASLDDGTPMAVRHAYEPWWGLQFHPESLLTDDGASILAAFLEVGARG